MTEYKTLTSKEVCSAMAALNKNAAAFGPLMNVNFHTVNIWRMKGVGGPAAILIDQKVKALDTYNIINPKTGKDLGHWPGINADCAVASYLAFEGYDGRTLKMDGDQLKLGPGSNLEPDISKWLPRDWIRAFHGVKQRSTDFLRIEHDALLMDGVIDGKTTVGTLRDWTICIAYSVWPAGARRRAKYFELSPSDEYQERIHLGDWWLEGYFKIDINENNQRRALESYNTRKHEVRDMIIED